MGPTSSGYWAEPLVNTYYEAVRSFQENHPGTAHPYFWELLLSFDEPIVLKAVHGITREIRMEPMALQPLGTSVFLRHLLRTRLSDIRGNHLWPEVEHFLQETAGVRLPSAKVQNFFRESLIQCHGDQLPRHKNRFVMFLLHDVGIGHRRSSLVRLFLEDLLIRRRLDANSPPNVVLANQLDQINDPDLGALSVVLETTGRALLAIRDFSAQHPHRVPSSDQSWDMIRAFWLKTLRLDLDRLLPEGRQILEPIMPHAVTHRPRRNGVKNEAIVHEGITLVAGVSQCGTVLVTNHHTPLRVETSEPLEIAGQVSTFREDRHDGTRRIHLEGWSSDPVILRTANSQWTIVNAEAATIVGGPEHTDWPDIRIIGRGIMPIKTSQVGSLKGLVPESWDQGFVDVSLEVPGCLPRQVAIQDMVQQADYFRAIGTGLLTIGFRYRGLVLPQKYHFYLFDTPPVVEPTPLGVPSIIGWLDRDGHAIQLEGASRENSVERMARAIYSVPGTGSHLICEWCPVLDDARLDADGTLVPEGSVFWLGNVQRALTLSFLGNMKASVALELAGQRIEPVDVMKVLGELLKENPPERMELVYGGKTSRMWTLATGPGNTRVAAEWSTATQIRGRVVWIGRTASTPRVTISGVSGIASNIQDNGIRGILGFHEFVADMVWDMDSVEATSAERLRIYAAGPQGSMELGIVKETADHEMRTIPQRIMQSLDRLDEDMAVWDVVYLVERYARRKASFPVSVDRLVRRLSARATVQSRAAIQSLYLMDALMKNRPTPHVPLSLDGAVGYAGSFYATLVLIDQVALYRQGLGNPAVLHQLVDEFSTRFEDKDVGEWCRLMVGYCHATTGIGLPDLKSPLLVSRPPLVLFDKHLRGWWNTLPTREDYHAENS